MAKKSRRQKLPTEKDLEKLSAPKPGESGDAPDSHSDRNEAPHCHSDRSEATHCHSERSGAESRNLTTEDATRSTYNIDGGISVSLA